LIKLKVTASTFAIHTSQHVTIIAKELATFIVRKLSTENKSTKAQQWLKKHRGFGGKLKVLGF